MRGRQAHHLKAALRQRMDISEQADLDEYMEESDSHLKRARSRLQVEMTANSEKTSDEALSHIPLLTVAKDLSQLRELEEARDADLQMQAVAIEEVQRQEKGESGRPRPSRRACRSRNWHFKPAGRRRSRRWEMLSSGTERPSQPSLRRARRCVSLRTGT